MDKLIRIFIFLSTFGLHAQNSQSDFSIKAPVDLAISTKNFFGPPTITFTYFNQADQFHWYFRMGNKQISSQIPAIFARQLWKVQPLFKIHWEILRFSILIKSVKSQSSIAVLAQNFQKVNYLLKILVKYFGKNQKVLVTVC